MNVRKGFEGDFLSFCRFRLELASQLAGYMQSCIFWLLVCDTVCATVTVWRLDLALGTCLARSSSKEVVLDNWQHRIKTWIGCEAVQLFSKFTSSLTNSMKVPCVRHSAPVSRGFFNILLWHCWLFKPQFRQLHLLHAHAQFNVCNEKC